MIVLEYKSVWFYFCFILNLHYHYTTCKYAKSQIDKKILTKNNSSDNHYSIIQYRF